MKKLFALLLSVLMLASCSSSKQGSTPTSKQDVVVWTTYTQAQIDVFKELASAYNASQDVVTVSIEQQPKNGFSEKVYQAVMTGNGPDIIIDYASTANNYVLDEKVIDFGKYFTKEDLNVTDKAWEEANSFSDGKMHTLPLFTSGPVLFYNEDLLNQANVAIPTTWEELVVASKIIKESTNAYGFGADSLTDLAQSMICQTGNQVVDTEKMEVTFNTEDVKKVLTLWQEGISSDAFLSRPLTDYFSGDFNSGNLAMFIGSVASEPYIEIENWNVAPIPQGGSVSWQPGWNRSIIGFNNGDENHEKAIVDFAKFLIQPENNAKFCIAANYTSPYYPTLEVDTYKEFVGNNKSQACLDSTTAGSFPALIGTSLRKTLENLMLDISSGKDVSEALETCVKDSNTALQELGQ